MIPFGFKTSFVSDFLAKHVESMLTYSRVCTLPLSLVNHTPSIADVICLTLSQFPRFFPSSDSGQETG